jgi:hypothetical protein
VPNNAYIQELGEVIHKLHGGTATHHESVPVKEVFQGQTVWDGVVEVFNLKGHPKTHRAYAWSHQTDDPKNPVRHVTVLHIPPVVSPLTAVRAALMQEYRNANPAQA